MGPDGISSRLFRSCVDQLCRIVEHISNLSLKLGRVAQLWKTSCVAPVPKTPHPMDQNSYRPVVLTLQPDEDTGEVGACLSPPPSEPIRGPLQFVSLALGWTLLSTLYIETSLIWKRLGALCVNIIQAMFLRDQLECTESDHHLTAWRLPHKPTKLYEDTGLWFSAVRGALQGIAHPQHCRLHAQLTATCKSS